MVRSKKSPKKNDGGGDEEKPCPCNQYKGEGTVWIQCDICSIWWHVVCVGLEGMTSDMIDSLSLYSCPCCFKFPETVVEVLNATADQLQTVNGNSASVSSITTSETRSLSLLMKDELRNLLPEMETCIKAPVETGIKSVQVEQVVKEANAAVGKSWADIAAGNQKELIQEVVKVPSHEALVESSQLIDANMSEERKRVNNVVLSGITEDVKDDELIMETVKLLGTEEIDKKDIVSARRLGLFDKNKKRPILITMRREDDAKFAHNYGRGYQVRNRVNVWFNPDLTQHQRDARYNSRVAKRKANAAAEQNRNKEVVPEKTAEVVPEEPAETHEPKNDS